MHYKTPLSHNGYMKSLENYENFIHSVLSGKKQTFLQNNFNSEPYKAYYPKWLKYYLVSNN
jgi:hypothetical protein